MVMVQVAGGRCARFMVQRFVNERTLACGNERSEQVLKQVCVVGRGCSSWVMSLMFSAEKMKKKTEELMEQPEGTQEHGIHQNLLF
jgi:hypothetical protein